ncbi:hypothetical protein L3Y34_000304 [Caenorhabditis briggsae]|uniref:C2H2-type domain-containing protein n=1 Tax=Caenorhabditis briggsae TaxID=6238 RepID=A0AAE9D908_CAEBR|nr:hypothetical protein L3Y34_000304 [Caenorhabditis briggsae]
MEEEEIDVESFDDANLESAETDFPCEHCKFVGKSARTLTRHKNQAHAQIHEIKVRSSRGRGRRKKEEFEVENPPIPARRVTTKELLGGRKRPKTVPIDDSALRTNQEASRLLEMGLITAETSIGEYLRRGGGGGEHYLADDMDPEEMIVGEEKFPQLKPRRYSEKLPERITIGDPQGKYKCYIKGCEWRGGYRSLRMDHIKALHPDWKMPSRYILQRITKNGEYKEDEEHIPPFACGVEGCDWRGNFRASRSAHMRKNHPEEHAAKKKLAPGYNCNGDHPCHIPSCGWRGWSRSTRSAHLKKAHPGYRPEDNRVLMVLSCSFCDLSFNTYPLLVDHIASHGGVGLHVEHFFSSRQDFEDWMRRIEQHYSIALERHDPCDPSDSQQEQTIYYYHCSIVGVRGTQLANNARAFTHNHHHYLKHRSKQLLTRQKSDCSAHLEVRENFVDGSLHVKGTLEHTGHRFGTPLLRMLPPERQLFCNLVDWKHSGGTEFQALDVVDQLTSHDGYAMENYEPAKEVTLMDPLDQNPLISMRILISQSDPECCFSVKFDEYNLQKMSFGYQNEEMQKAWHDFGPNGIVTIDTDLIDFCHVSLTQYTVLLLDDNSVPRCAMMYLTTDAGTGPETVINRLVELDGRAPKIFVTDPSQCWVDLIQKAYETSSSPPKVFISEWSLIDYWSAKVQEFVENDLDLFSLIAALRRSLRTEEPVQLYSFFVELLEACYECGFDNLASFFDSQLSDPEYFKRWSPLNRSGDASHLYVRLGVASRTLRDMYLGLEEIPRVDQWFAHATKRIQDFNSVESTHAYSTKPIEHPRKFYYGSVDVDQLEEVIYEEEEILAGEVVEEEIIGHEIQEELTLQEGEELIYEEIEEPDLYQEQERVQKRPEVSGNGPKTLEMMETEEQVGEVVDERLNNVPKIPPHRLRISELPKIPEPPPIRRRETTKSVIRSRPKRDRFADLRDCPPEVMRAIAAHAIAYDGRRKEQSPFMFVPEAAKMATNGTPSVPTPDMRPFGAPAARRMTPAQMTSIQEQRRLKRDQQKWYRRGEEGEEGDVEEEIVEEVVEEDEPSSPPPKYIPPHRLPRGTTTTAIHQQHHEEVVEEEDYDPDAVPIYEEVVEYIHDDEEEGIYEEHVAYDHPNAMVVHEEEVVDVDDSQPCTSSSMYR